MLSSLFYIGLIKVIDDHSWMYRDSPQGLRNLDYCNVVQGFINYAISNPRNVSESGIKCPCKRCENKRYLDSDVVTMYLLQKKKFMEHYMCRYAHEEPYISHETIVEMMIGSTSSTSNVHGVVDDNSNPYRTMIMDIIGMN
jgi:hypothetical protein